MRCIAAVWVKTLLFLVVYHAENYSQKCENCATGFCKDILCKPAKAAYNAAVFTEAKDFAGLIEKTSDGKLKYGFVEQSLL